MCLVGEKFCYKVTKTLSRSYKMNRRIPFLSYQTNRIICLHIPDEFEFMDPDLIQLLEERAVPYLERNPITKSDEQGQ